jgi:4-oxalocrotonate tautomerase
MPVVTIQVTREGSAPGRTSVTAAEKAALISGVSDLLLKVLDKPLASTFVVIDEVETENWGWGGLPVEEFRAQQGGMPGSPARASAQSPSALIDASTNRRMSASCPCGWNTRETGLEGACTSGMNFTAG